MKFRNCSCSCRFSNLPTLKLRLVFLWTYSCSFQSFLLPQFGLMLPLLNCFYLFWLDSTFTIIFEFGFCLVEVLRFFIVPFFKISPLLLPRGSFLLLDLCKVSQWFHSSVAYFILLDSFYIFYEFLNLFFTAYIWFLCFSESHPGI